MVTIWQSELAGLVQDRELQDAMLRLIDGWAAQAHATIRMLRPFLDAARAATPPRATPPAAAPDARDQLIAELLERVVALERRLGPP